MTLTQEQIALLPTDEEVELYRQRGYYLSRPLFSESDIDEILAESERFYASDFDEPPVQSEDLLRFRPTGPPREGLRKNDQSSMFNRRLRWLATHPLIGAVAARLTGASSIRLWHDQLLYKPPTDPAKPSNVGWHTDRGYWKTCSSLNMVTAWIPFHDCDEAMGTITMVDGSLNWPDNTNQLDFFSSDLAGLEAKFDSGGNPIVKTPMLLKKGQVSFHHSLTIHGSGPNLTDRPRRSIAVHLQDEDNHWQWHRSQDGRIAQHDNDRLCRKIRGVPDYTDPQFCPVLWPLEGVMNF